MSNQITIRFSISSLLKVEIPIDEKIHHIGEYKQRRSGDIILPLGGAVMCNTTAKSELEQMFNAFDFEEAKGGFFNPKYDLRFKVKNPNDNTIERVLEWYANSNHVESPEQAAWREFREEMEFIRFNDRPYFSLNHIGEQDENQDSRREGFIGSNTYRLFHIVHIKDSLLGRLNQNKGLSAVRRYIEKNRTNLRLVTESEILNEYSDIHGIAVADHFEHLLKY
jgi:hypothetical protein